MSTIKRRKNSRNNHRNDNPLSLVEQTLGSKKYHHILQSQSSEDLGTPFGHLPQLINNNENSKQPSLFTSLFDLNTVLPSNDSIGMKTRIVKEIIPFKKVILQGSKISVENDCYVSYSEQIVKDKSHFLQEKKLNLNIVKGCTTIDRLNGNAPSMPSLRLDMGDKEWSEPVRDRNHNWIKEQCDIINADKPGQQEVLSSEPNRNGTIPKKISLGQYNFEKDSSPNYWSPIFQSLIRRTRMLKTAITISETPCIVEIYGVGITGRIFTEGSTAGKMFILEIYSVWNSQKFVVTLNVTDIKLLLKNKSELMKVGHKHELIQQLLKHLYFEYSVTIHPPAVTMDEINEYEEALAIQLAEEAKLKDEKIEKWKEMEAKKLTDKADNKLIEVIDKNSKKTLVIDSNKVKSDKDVISDELNLKQSKFNYKYVIDTNIGGDTLLECPEISYENDASNDISANIDEHSLVSKTTEEVIDEKQARIEYVRKLLTQPIIKQETIHLDRPNIPKDLRYLPQTVSEIIAEKLNPNLITDPFKERNPRPDLFQNLKIGPIERGSGRLLRKYEAEQKLLAIAAEEERKRLAWLAIRPRKRGLQHVRCFRSCGRIVVLMVYIMPSRPSSVNIYGHVPIECVKVNQTMGLTFLQNFWKTKLVWRNWSDEFKKELVVNTINSLTFSSGANKPSQGLQYNTVLYKKDGDFLSTGQQMDLKPFPNAWENKTIANRQKKRREIYINNDFKREMTDDETFPFKIPNLFFSDFNCRVDRLEQKTRYGYQRFMKPRRLIGRQIPLFTRSMKIGSVYGIVNIRIATDKENPTISRGLKGQPPTEFKSLSQFQQVLQKSVIKTHLKHTYNPDSVIIMPPIITVEKVYNEDDEDNNSKEKSKKKRKKKEKEIKPKPQSIQEINAEITLLLSHIVTQIEDVQLVTIAKLKDEEEARLKEIEKTKKIIEIEDENSPSELVVPCIIEEIIEEISNKNDFIISTEITHILTQLVAEVAHLTPPKPFTRVYPTIVNTIKDNKNNIPIYCHSYIRFERKRKLQLEQERIIKSAKEEEQMKLDQIQFEIMEAKINWYNSELLFIEEERRLLIEEEDKNKKIWRKENPENVWNFYEKPIFPGDVDKTDVFNCLKAAIDIVAIHEDLIGIMNELLIDVELNIESEKEMAAILAKLEADEKQDKEKNERELKKQKALAKKKRREENSDSDYSESESDNESEINENTDENIDINVSENTNENGDSDEVELSRVEDKPEEEEEEVEEEVEKENKEIDDDEDDEKERNIDAKDLEEENIDDKDSNDHNDKNVSSRVVYNSDGDDILPDHAEDNDNIENKESIVAEGIISNSNKETQEGGDVEDNDDDDTYTDTDIDIDRSALESRQSIRTIDTDATDATDNSDDETTIGTKSRPGTADTDSLTVGDDNNNNPLQVELDEDGNPILANSEEQQQEQVHINYFDNDEDDDLLGLGDGPQYENDENELQNKAFLKYAPGAEIEIEIYLPTDSTVLDGYVIPSTTVYRGKLNKDDLLKIIPNKEIIFSGLRAAYEEFYKEEYNLEQFLEIMKVWEYLGDEILSKSKWMLQYPVEEGGDHLYEGLLEKVHKVDILTNKVIKNIKPVKKDVNIYPPIPDIVLSWSLIFFNSFVKVRSKSEFRKVVKLQIVLYQDNDTFGIIAYDREMKDIYFLDCPTEVQINQVRMYRFLPLEVKNLNAKMFLQNAVVYCDDYDEDDKLIGRLEYTDEIEEDKLDIIEDDTAYANAAAEALLVATTKKEMLKEKSAAAALKKSDEQKLEKEKAERKKQKELEKKQSKSKEEGDDEGDDDEQVVNILRLHA